MKNNMTKTLVLSLFGLTAANASATELLLTSEATLSCQTHAVCGYHTAASEVKVFENAAGTQRALFWSSNVPSSQSAPDIYTAYTIGGACAAVDPVPNFTTTWELGLQGRPLKATVTMCDGVTQAEYSVSLPRRGGGAGGGFDDGGCVSLPWGDVCNY